MKRINGRGWFVWTVSSLAAGEDPRTEGNPYTRGVEQRSLDFGVAEKLQATLREDFDVLRDTGVARCSRKGWWYVDHPILGQVSWKAGVDFRSGKEYLFLRVGGRPVLAYWPGLSHPRENKRYFPAEPAPLPPPSRNLIREVA